MDKEMVKENNDEFVYRKSLKKSSDVFMEKIKFIDRYLNRPIASLIVKMVFRTRITPNDLTYISCLFGIIGAYFFSRGSYVAVIIGGCLAQMSSIVDGADGMLARAKDMRSTYGSHLDLLLDRIIDFFVIAGISIGVYTNSGNPNMAILGILTGGLYLLQIHLFYLTKSFQQVTDMGDNGEARAVLFWVILVFAVIGRMDICIYVLLTETIIVNIVRLIYFMKLGPKKESK
jgi:1L-myo-inositol 1-phosphate cytidylyltransferase / CDP-L-myo-inositol myo-inositolphosphotransferase